MFNALFTTTNKRTNSTEVPSMTGAATIAIELLDSTSLMNPSIRIVQSGNPVSYNYVYISEFNRYYFINDWTSDHGQWIASLSCDVLATYKSSVIAAQEYVLRSASSYDGTIFDSYYPTKAQKLFKRLTPLNTLTWTGQGQSQHYPLAANESFIVGIYGLLDVSAFADQTAYISYINNNTRGAITYYWMSLAEIVGLCYYLASNNSIANMYSFSDITDGMKKVLINPMQYIASVTAIPVAKATGTGVVTVTGIQYGWYGITAAEAYAPDQVYTLAPLTLYTEGCSFDFRSAGVRSLHPQASRGSYLNSNPYTKASIVFPPFGEIPIDLSLCPGAYGIRCNIQFEPVQGTAVLDIYPYKEGSEGGQSTLEVDFSTKLYHGEAQVGIEVALNQLSVNNMQTFNGILSTAAGAAGSLVTGNIPGAISSVASGIESAVESQFPQNQTKGINGSLLQKFLNGPFMFLEFSYIVDEDLSQLGRPLCQQVTLSTLSGYCLCRDADVKISGATENEIDAVKAYMNGGFFIE